MNFITPNIVRAFISTAVLLFVQCVAGQSDTGLVKIHSIEGRIAPKSVVYSGNGLFFAQNMMYEHTITVYNRDFELLKTISDEVMLSTFGIRGFTGLHKGAPVEAAFSHDGKYVWVSNYQMYGKGFDSPGCDGCQISDNYDQSFVYRINTQSYEVEKIIRTGCVPKYLAVTPDDHYVIVSNWSSGDISIINADLNKEVKKIKVGAFPRGIVISKDSKTAWVAVMGSTKIAVIDISEYKVKGWIENVGRAPRHLCIDSKNDFMYATINNEGLVKKIDLSTDSVTGSVQTGCAPRSMVLGTDGKFLYVVNYSSNTVSKVRTKDMKVIQSVRTADKPIGITYDRETSRIWVACYSGVIMVFEDKGQKQPASSKIIEGMADLYRNDCINSFTLNHIFSNPYHFDIPVHQKAIAANKSSSKLPPVETPEIVSDSVPKTKGENPEIAVEKNTQPESVKLLKFSTNEIDVSHNLEVISGCFGTEANAEKHCQFLKSKGYSAKIVDKKGKLFRVSCGSTNNIEEAERIQNKARTEIDTGVWILKNNK
ncbi:MAG: SPOR domain-containing protein [Bacteroidetes bacterium]|nr:SPOR domain-containing protein [Bacteroidota bacterium]MBU1720343.1 SPOR domain-containing protein [Bacteroidota bacterium]